MHVLRWILFFEDMNTLFLPQLLLPQLNFFPCAHICHSRVMVIIIIINTCCCCLLVVLSPSFKKLARGYIPRKKYPTYEHNNKVNNIVKKAKGMETLTILKEKKISSWIAARREEAMTEDETRKRNYHYHPLWIHQVRKDSHVRLSIGKKYIDIKTLKIKKYMRIFLETGRTAVVLWLSSSLPFLIIFVDDLMFLYRMWT